ncbi:beta-lactamase [Haladaptatus paucihalophilus DX253]|uniref:Beta-lactamase n=1 Tax=Haladaptatus paucihalophilus DX253 TaxID=797209 RepID=E7QPE7_HALPU|nr:serine hydrolase [Haladaptatus paucihalophilus]EFW94108.1 beta-lactamase [Haladaptatus paucihalophilus DX253]SHK61529.1 beta-lactamase class A [Haladaptatus paucihalophilus DX253]
MRPDTPAIDTRDELAATIAAYDETIDGDLGVFLGFPSGPDEFDVVCSHDETRVFQSASTVKLPVFYALYERYDADDRLDELDRPCPLSPENRVGGSGLLHLLNATPTVEDLARAMISVSDNAATNQLIDHLGMSAVNDAAARLGMDRTRLARKMMTTLEDTDFGEFDVHVPADEPTNATTPLDCARFFADLACETTLSAAAYERMRVPLAAQKDTSMVPRYLPYETDVAHKTGRLPTAALDTGFLSVPDRDRPLVFSVFIDGVGGTETDGARATSDTGADAADAIAEIGDAVFAWLR